MSDPDPLGLRPTDSSVGQGGSVPFPPGQSYPTRPNPEGTGGERSGGGLGGESEQIYDEVIYTDIQDPSRWCASAQCPELVGPDHVFHNDSQAIAYLNLITSAGASGVYAFGDSTLNSGELWAHYRTASGKQAVRWKPGAGWVRRTTGFTAAQGVSVARTLKYGGRVLLVVGGALEGGEQWQRDDGYDPGVRLFRSTAAGATKAVFTWGGAPAFSSAAGAFCRSAATISCGGPIGTGVVVGVAGVAGGFLGSEASDVVIDRLL